MIIETNCSEKLVSILSLINEHEAEVEDMFNEPIGLYYFEKIKTNIKQAQFCLTNQDPLDLTPFMLRKMMSPINVIYNTLHAFFNSKNIDYLTKVYNNTKVLLEGLELHQ